MLVLLDVVKANSVAMLGTISKYIKNVSVVRRLLFAVMNLPKDLPNLWGVAVEFATWGQETRHTLNAEQAKLLVQNVQELDLLAFDSDKKLLEDLMVFQVPKCKPLGLILISSKSDCFLCGSKLMLRKDRPSPVVIYDDNMGTIPGSHFHKYCTNQACGLTQYYGYYTTGGISSQVIFDPEWETLPYFVSSRESVFSMDVLRRFNAEIILGQLSFKQCADVYNLYTNILSHHCQIHLPG